jgi:hypothetical protein
MVTASLRILGVAKLLERMEHDGNKSQDGLIVRLHKAYRLVGVYT